VGDGPADDQMFHILYDGTVFDQTDHAALGGDSEAINTRLAETFSDALDLEAAVRLGVAALAGPDRTIHAEDLEVACLRRGNGRRCFHRLTESELTAALDGQTEGESAASPTP
jgi:proteasome alpha subunit